VLLYVVGHVLKDFHVRTFSAAFWGALIISIVSLVLNALTKTNGSTVQIRRGAPPRRPPDDNGGGPVIDV
jgi:hypothetical protein